MGNTCEMKYVYNHIKAVEFDIESNGKNTFVVDLLENLFVNILSLSYAVTSGV